MLPTLGRFAGITWHAWGTAILLGVLVAAALIWVDLRNRGVPSDQRLRYWLDLHIATLAGGMVGGRLLYVATSWDRVPNAAALFALTGTGFVSIGALIGAVAAVWVVGRTHERPRLESLDLLATYAPLGEAFGRVGCLAAGCCYGAPTELPWALAFGPGSIAALDAALPHDGSHTVPLHPVQVYSSIGLLLLFAWQLRARARGTAHPGLAVARYAAGYGVLRFILELFRGDEDRRFLLEWASPPVARMLHVPSEGPLLLSTAQFASLLLAVAGFTMMRRLRVR